MSKENFIPVLRHGQFNGPGLDERNYANFVSSLSDESKRYPLTEIGKAQVIETVRQIARYGRTGLIVAGEFLRTQQSAEVIAGQIREETGQKVEIITSPLLNPVWMPPDSMSESEFVELERTGIKNAVADAMFQKWASGQVGESPEMVKMRIKAFLAFLDGLLDNWRPNQPVIVTHASFSSAVLRDVMGVDLKTPRNEAQILKVAGYYFLIGDGDLSPRNFRIDLLKEKFLA